MKLKALAAAVALLGLSAGAQAALLGPTNSTGSELTFNIWNNDANNAGYVKDLGITLDGFNAANAQSFVLTDAGVLAGWNAASASMLWNIVGAKNVGNRYVSTIVDNTPGTFGSGALTNNGNINSAISQAGVYYGALTSGAGFGTLNSTTNGSATTTGTDTNAFANNLSQGGGVINELTDNFANQGDNSNSSKLFFALYNASGASLQTTLYSGFWTLTFNGAQGAATSATLSWTPTATAVPVPAAAWLMGSALVGLTGIGRRRKA